MANPTRSRLTRSAKPRLAVVLNGQVAGWVCATVERLLTPMEQHARACVKRLG
jgi:hypothetical protein